ncbi:clasp N terminal-domain-containing protein [Globomyces pollinis-pini]|nr:clasp N terminal-domain-containing protein [Globomyces pollinis-pini]
MKKPETMITDQSSLDMYVKQALRLFEQKETEQTWMKFEESLLKTTAIIKNSHSVPGFMNSLKPLKASIIQALNSERTRLARTALELITTLAEQIPDQFDTWADALLPAVLKLTTRANKVYVASAQATLKKCIQLAGVISLAPILVESLKSPSKTLRHSAMECMVLLVETNDTAKLRHSTTFIESAITTGVVDPTPEVRNGSKQLFEYYKSSFPDLYERYSEKLSEAAKKTLKLDRKRIVNNVSQKTIKPFSYELGEPLATKKPLATRPIRKDDFQGFYKKTTSKERLDIAIDRSNIDVNSVDMLPKRARADSQTETNSTDFKRHLDGPSRVTHDQNVKNSLNSNTPQQRIVMSGPQRIVRQTSSEVVNKPRLQPAQRVPVSDISNNQSRRNSISDQSQSKVVEPPASPPLNDHLNGFKKSLTNLAVAKPFDSDLSTAVLTKTLEDIKVSEIGIPSVVDSEQNVKIKELTLSQSEEAICTTSNIEFTPHLNSKVSGSSLDSLSNAANVSIKPKVKSRIALSARVAKPKVNLQSGSINLIQLQVEAESKDWEIRLRVFEILEAYFNHEHHVTGIDYSSSLHERLLQLMIDGLDDTHFKVQQNALNSIFAYVQSSNLPQKTLDKIFTRITCLCFTPNQKIKAGIIQNALKIIHHLKITIPLALIGQAIAYSLANPKNSYKFRIGAIGYLDSLTNEELSETLSKLTVCKTVISRLACTVKETEHSYLAMLRCLFTKFSQLFEETFAYAVHSINASDKAAVEKLLDKIILPPTISSPQIQNARRMSSTESIRRNSASRGSIRDISAQFRAESATPTKASMFKNIDDLLLTSPSTTPNPSMVVKESTSTRENELSPASKVEWNTATTPTPANVKALLENSTKNESNLQETNGNTRNTPSLGVIGRGFTDMLLNEAEPMHLMETSQSFNGTGLDSKQMENFNKSHSAFTLKQPKLDLQKLAAPKTPFVPKEKDKSSKFKRLSRTTVVPFELKTAAKANSMNQSKSGIPVSVEGKTVGTSIAEELVKPSGHTQLQLHSDQDTGKAPKLETTNSEIAPPKMSDVSIVDDQFPTNICNSSVQDQIEKLDIIQDSNSIAAESNNQEAQAERRKSSDGAQLLISSHEEENINELESNSKCEVIIQVSEDIPSKTSVKEFECSQRLSTPKLAFLRPAGDSKDNGSPENVIVKPTALSKEDCESNLPAKTIVAEFEVSRRKSMVGSTSLLPISITVDSEIALPAKTKVAEFEVSRRKSMVGSSSLLPFSGSADNENSLSPKSIMNEMGISRKKSAVSSMCLQPSPGSMDHEKSLPAKTTVNEFEISRRKSTASSICLQPTPVSVDNESVLPAKTIVNEFEVSRRKSMVGSTFLHPQPDPVVSPVSAESGISKTIVQPFTISEPRKSLQPKSIDDVKESNTAPLSSMSTEKESNLHPLTGSKSASSIKATTTQDNFLPNVHSDADRIINSVVDIPVHSEPKDIILDTNTKLEMDQLPVSVAIHVENADDGVSGDNFELPDVTQTKYDPEAPNALSDTNGIESNLTGSHPIVTGDSFGTDNLSNLMPSLSIGKGMEYGSVNLGSQSLLSKATDSFFGVSNSYQVLTKPTQKDNDASSIVSDGMDLSHYQADNSDSDMYEKNTLLEKSTVMDSKSALTTSIGHQDLTSYTNGLHSCITSLQSNALESRVVKDRLEALQAQLNSCPSQVLDHPMVTNLLRAVFELQPVLEIAGLVTKTVNLIENLTDPEILMHAVLSILEVEVGFVDCIGLASRTIVKINNPELIQLFDPLLIQQIVKGLKSTNSTIKKSVFDLSNILLDARDDIWTEQFYKSIRIGAGATREAVIRGLREKAVDLSSREGSKENLTDSGVNGLNAIKINWTNNFFLRKSFIRHDNDEEWYEISSVTPDNLEYQYLVSNRTKDSLTLSDSTRGIQYIVDFSRNTITCIDNFNDSFILGNVYETFALK